MHGGATANSGISARSSRNSVFHLLPIGAHSISTLWQEERTHVVVGAAELGADLLRVERVGSGQPLGRALLGLRHDRRQHAAQLVAEGVERGGVICDAQGV